MTDIDNARSIYLNSDDRKRLGIEMTAGACETLDRLVLGKDVKFSCSAALAKGLREGQVVPYSLLPSVLREIVDDGLTLYLSRVEPRSASQVTLYVALKPEAATG